MNRQSVRILWGLLALFVSSVGRAQPAGGGRSQSSAIAPAVLLKAEAGDPVAQYQVGWHYEHPDAVCCGEYTESRDSRHDYAHAALWYRRAAEQGNVLAQVSLGEFYLFGDGVPVDYVEGIKWYRRAADRGSSGAQFELGQIYSEGKFAPQDFALAAFWYRKSAERGNPDGQAVLATLYRDGQGVSRNYSEAYFWMSLAAANQELTGTYSFLAKEHADERDRIAAHLNNAELLNVQKRTREWLAARHAK